MWHALIVIGIKYTYTYVFLRAVQYTSACQKRNQSKIAIYVGFLCGLYHWHQGVGIRVTHTLMAPNINPLNTCCYTYFCGAS